MSFRLKPAVYSKASRLRDTKYQTSMRKPLQYEVRKFVSFLEANRLQVEMLSDNDLIIMYRRKEVMYLDFSPQVGRTYIGIYYDYRLAGSMDLSGKYNSTYMNMLILEYKSLSDVASDILTYLTNTYVSYKPYKLKL